MSPKHWAIIVGGSIIVIVSLFPPYIGVFAREGDNVYAFVGHSFLLMPPTNERVYQILHNKAQAPETVENRALFLLSHYSRIDLERFTIELIAIVAATGLMYFFLRHRE